jgi:hypothetical protein
VNEKRNYGINRINGKDGKDLVVSVVSVYWTLAKIDAERGLKSPEFQHSRHAI